MVFLALWLRAEAGFDRGVWETAQAARHRIPARCLDARLPKRVGCGARRAKWISEAARPLANSVVAQVLPRVAARQHSVPYGSLHLLLLAGSP